MGTLTRSLGLFLCITLVSTMEEDKTNLFDVKAVRPSDPGSINNSLEIRCSFDVSKTNFIKLNSMKLSRSEENEEEKSSPMGFVTDRRVFNLGSPEFSVSGTLDENSKSTIEVIYASENGGYCRTYYCFASGKVEGEYKSKTFSKKLKVETEDGSSCVSKQIQDLSGRVDQCCEASEQVDKNSALLQTLAQKMDGLSALPGKAQEQSQELDTLAERVSGLSSNQDSVENKKEDIEKYEEQISELSEKLDGVVQSNEESAETIEALKTSVETLAYALGKYLEINTVKYDVSGLYNGHVYIASKDEPEFDLAEMDELCAEYSGYLAEIDDDDEEEFLEEFTTSIGEYKFAIGANDVDNEGEFVYYNSKKPVPDSIWIKNQPSNSLGIEDCVQILEGGLNDIKCDQNMKYVCEIPLA